MTKKEKKSLKGEYEKVSVSGHEGYGRGSKPYVHIGIKDFSYGVGEVASAAFTIKEAKEIVSLIESAIKQATKKEKN